MANLKILLADDHAIVRRGLKELLLEEYPSVVIGEAGNSDVLMTLLAEEEWSLLICDINMPKRSGLELLPEVKELYPQMPVLIVSMYAEEQYAMRAFKAGTSGYLGKETAHYNLVKAVQTVLNGRKFITPSIAEQMAASLESDMTGLPHESLSNREFEVMKMLTKGQSISDIAKKLVISVNTISTYRTRILDKMGMSSNAELIRYLYEKGLM